MPTRYLAVFAILVFGAAFFSRPATSSAQARIESYHGSWTVRCNMRGKHIDMCGASNRKRTGVRGVLLKVRVQIFVYRARGRWFLQVVTPGNVDKSKGVRLELDGQYVKTIPIIKCDTHDPCRAQIPFTASLRKRFSGAKTATIEFAAEKKPRFEMTVKLNGLAEAMEAAVRR